MSDLIKVIKEAFASEYSFEKQSGEEFISLGDIRIPHPDFGIVITLERKLSFDVAHRLENEPLSSVAPYEICVGITGIDQGSLRIYEGSKSRRVCVEDPFGIYKNLSEGLDLTTHDGFIKFLERFRVLQVKDFVRAKQPESIKIRRISAGYSVEGSDVNLCVDENFVKNLEREDTSSLDQLLQSDFGSVILDLSLLYAKRMKSLEGKSLPEKTLEQIERKIYKLFKSIGTPLEKRLNTFSTLVTFGDRACQPWRDMPIYSINLFDTNFIASQEVQNDNEFLRSLAKYVKAFDSKHYYLSPVTQFTRCERLQGQSRDYFIKEMDITKVLCSDYELGAAFRLREMGFEVPEPIGIAVVCSSPHLLFEYRNNAINLMGQDCSYICDEMLNQRLEEYEPEVYKALGQYVKRMFDHGVIDLDMAKRNFMVEFNDDGSYKRIFQVDFEKTVFLEDRPDLVGIKKAKIKMVYLQKMRKQLSKLEKKYFDEGYKA